MESSIEDDEAGDEELSDDLTVDSNVNEGTSSQEIEVESNSQNDERQEPDVGPASDQLDQPTDNEIHDSSSDSLDAWKMKNEKMKVESWKLKVEKYAACPILYIELSYL